MTYCGSIGSVNVLEFMSTDLFDESQENPFLLQQPSPRSASPSKSRQASVSSSMWSHQHAPTAAYELPLEDQDGGNCGTMSPLTGMSRQYAASPPKVMTQQSAYHHQPPPQSPSASSPSKAAAPSPSGRASVTFNLPKSILKRQSSYESDASTVPSDSEAVDVNETELRKLLYSLARFSVASETSVASSPSPQYIQQQQQRQYSMSQPASPSPHNASGPLWFGGAQQSQPEETRCRSPGRPPAQKSETKKKARSKSADRGYETDPGGVTSDDEDYYYDEEERRSQGARSHMRSRGSVTFETVKNLLRGGGGVSGGSRASRIVKRTVPDFRRKSAGTVASRLKMRQKFERPTIMTDAYHRVSTMRLGTKPLPTKIKHIAFPGGDDALAFENEADPGMLSPKGQLRQNSLVMLETLDKIGTRAACPVHLIDVELPDYSNVRARVDSYNHAIRPRQGLRRPSAWIVGAVPTYPSPPCYDSD